MYYSDGKVQSSVADGASRPVNALDEACRNHDTAYANAVDDRARNTADDKFYLDTQNLGIRGPIYGKIVKYGNQVTRQGKMAFLVPFGALVGASLGGTAFLSGLLPGKGGPKSNLRKEDTPTDLVTGTIYQPPTTDAPLSGGKFEPAVGLPGNARASDHPLSSSWAIALQDPGLMQPIGLRSPVSVRPAPTRTYKPLKKKKYMNTASMRKLYDKYNPPKNKTNKVTPFKQNG